MKKKIPQEMLTARLIPINKKSPKIPDSYKDIRNLATRPIIQILIEGLIIEDLKKMTQDD